MGETERGDQLEPEGLTKSDETDYVTEMKKHKHPYDKGMPGRIGIEF